MPAEHQRSFVRDQTGRIGLGSFQFHAFAPSPDGVPRWPARRRHPGMQHVGHEARCGRRGLGRRQARAAATAQGTRLSEVAPAAPAGVG